MEELILKLKQHEYVLEDSGLDSSEIEDINETLGYEIPLFFVDFLKVFGFGQGPFWAIFKEQDDFLEQNELISELGYSNLIAIGDQYAENLIVADINTQELYLLEDDLLLGLKTTFEQMLHQGIESLELPDFTIQQHTQTQFDSLLEGKSEICATVKQTLLELSNKARNNEDSLYSITIAPDSDGNYTAFGGSLIEFKTQVAIENIDYDQLWSIASARYQMPIVSTQAVSKGMDLLFLDVLKDLEKQGVFGDQFTEFSISVQSDEVCLFLKDTHDEALTKKNNLETIIKRYWETSYQRTKVLQERL